MAETTNLVESRLEEWMNNSCRESTVIETSYGNYVRRKWIFMGICIIIAVVVIGLALTIGTYPVSFTETYEIIWAHLTHNVTKPVADEVIFDIRMPRIIAGIFAGAGLAVAGACMQSTLKNPLADPYTTGVSAGASLGLLI